MVTSRKRSHRLLMRDKRNFNVKSSEVFVILEYCSEGGIDAVGVIGLPTISTINSLSIRVNSLSKFTENKFRFYPILFVFFSNGSRRREI